jgi:hypothetical protein
MSEMNVLNPRYIAILAEGGGDISRGGVRRAAE